MNDAIEMRVTENGFEPNTLRVRAGEPVRLRVKRSVVRTCATAIEVPGLLPRTPLPLGQTIEVEFLPTHAGTFRFGCPMSQHVGGALVVEG